MAAYKRGDVWWFKFTWNDEHGGDPSSVEFCYQVSMNYVSCSPYRVPIARLAAAQAAIAGGDKSEAMRTA
jgi:phosphoenolpyruvate synthase/pyruvate phosphate dikinase